MIQSILDTLPRKFDWEGELQSSFSSTCMVYCFEEVPSTMELARAVAQLAQRDCPLVIVAERQTNGRGRQGRNWEGASGALFLTLVQVSDRPLKDFSGFSLLVGIAARRVLEEFGCTVYLKWPNDLLTSNRRKVGGILVELATREEQSVVMSGIGINLLVPPRSVPDASSVLEVCGTRISVPDFVKAFVPTSMRLFGQFNTGGFEPFREVWLAGAQYRGEAIAYDTGTRIVRGTMRGVSSNGSLLVETAAGLEEVVSGRMI